MDRPKFSTLNFELNFEPSFPLKMAEIEKNKQYCGKTSAIRLSKYVKIKGLSPPSFPGKIRLVFAIFSKKQAAI